ncbi:hypothetical protein M5X17_13065 [Paenibacillus alvei]|uniref:KTSC domain-containing protein n=1 Tax=Paenibacillus alvei TaxID=44250 RepID=A0ABT4GXS0_PAEAL|nr:hypothetical protein [Paenibacillus alvei]MCY9734664.1 hypothetical protein [Paenibacillus alvei]MCY9761211.1 hypothetical protein [Paenibacillus alvei]MCY9765745.1 hypothetical protein [Paenibacillus alvei]
MSGYVQMDLFIDIEQEPLLNGMYYERSTDKFVSFVLGRRYFETSAKKCTFEKAWQEKTQRERAID